VDFGIPTGTAVLSSASGIVKGTGDTDAVCPGASYGKWVLIEHPFGLSTLYAHLSVIQVNEGTDVSAGSVIGYSGDTGYSTGPHLHYTVYATQGVKITERKSRVCKGSYRMPLADLRAYLNPLSYLPEK
jgi:murein DD-endopeptidase MepM/ murein hydrolase activator NlpD